MSKHDIAADAHRLNWLACGGWEVLQDPRYWAKELNFRQTIDSAIAECQTDALMGKLRKMHD